jgi:hypothetical protein
MKAENLPNSLRYVKNGPSGRWWSAAKTSGQLHAGWKDVPANLLEAADFAAIEPVIRALWKGGRGTTQDINALRTLVNRPSQHVWITFQEGCMWWCTVHDKIEANPEGDTIDRGHFWLTCASPWSNYSMDGRRLAETELPGSVTAVAGFRATVCEPSASDQILRLIRNQENPLARAATLARLAYQDAIAKLVAELGPKDFEVLVDLILSRSGWARIAVVGGARADIDIEVENAALDEIAFVQVKSRASQSTLDNYVARFNVQSDRYRRMIFAVHSPIGTLAQPDDPNVQIWRGKEIAQLVVKHGLGDWVATRL